VIFEITGHSGMRLKRPILKAMIMEREKRMSPERRYPAINQIYANAVIPNTTCETPCEVSVGEDTVPSS